MHSTELSIGKFAGLAKVTTRTVRYYETFGLLPKSNRSDNNYRSYDRKWLERMARIKDLRELGFSLEDIKTILSVSDSDLRAHLEKRLRDIDLEVIGLSEKRMRVQSLLSVSNKIETSEPLTESERQLYMNCLRQEALEGLKTHYPKISKSTLDYLDRDEWISKSPEIGAFIQAFKRCIQFAKDQNLAIGPLRGSAPASLSLFGLGLSGVDPLNHAMIPERLSTQQPCFHIDVEFERGQIFVDFCREISRTLQVGEIQAFKMPLIDIVQSTHRVIGRTLDYDAINNNDDLVLQPFRSRDFAKIFQFDFSQDALVMAYERFVPEYFGFQKISEHFEGQTEFNFRDIINITALWRPHRLELIERIDRYKRAKANSFCYEELAPEIQEWLLPNSGLILYHEDILKIVAFYTQWDYARCNRLRRNILNQPLSEARNSSTEWLEFERLTPPKIVELLSKESPWTFCLPHAVSFAKFTKQTAVLKSLHTREYFEQIEVFEQKHSIRWDDIGIRIKGVSLHQN